MITITIEFTSTGLTIQKVLNPIEAWKLLNLLEPTNFPTQEDFIKRWTKK